MQSTERASRIAGAIYLLLALVAPLRLMVIPAKLFVKGDAAATAGNIAAHETLFRLGIVGDLVTGTIALVLMFALYRLFENVDRTQAVLMVVLGGLMVTPIYFVNTLTDVGALLLVRGDDALAVIGKAERDALALLFLRLHHHGVLANEIFWGLWLFPFAVLVLKCRFLPRIFGWWLILNGIAYIVVSLVGFLLPQHEERVSAFAFPALFGELAIMLWLLIRGAKVREAGS